MVATPTPPPPRSSRKGLLIVIVLAVIFFSLIGLILTAVKSRPGAEPSADQKLYVVPTKLRIRTEPSAKAAVLTTASRGQSVRLLEDQGAWVRVQNSGGLQGWAERAALEGEAEHQRRITRLAAIRKLPPLDGEVEKAAALFSGPGIFYPVVGELKADTKVRVYTRDHDFYAIDAGGDIGYVEIDAINISSAAAAQLEVAAAAEPTTSTGESPLPEETSTASSMAEAEPSPSEPELAEQRAETEERERGDSVYPAVPSGGTQPEVLTRTSPRYPSAARRARVDGLVLIRGIVRRDGTLSNLEILKDQPYGLGEAAREAVERWRFRPATYQGRPIEVYYTVTVNYRLD